MPQIDFYSSKERSQQFSLRTACRLAEKAHHAGLRAHIQTNDSEETQALDMLLWTFRDRSFIPHQVFPTEEITCPVTIGNGDSPAEAEMLINLSQKIPENIEAFQRIAEIIDPQDESIRAGRERYRLYHGQGLKPQHHTIS